MLDDFYIVEFLKFYKFDTEYDFDFIQLIFK